MSFLQGAHVGLFFDYVTLQGLFIVPDPVGRHRIVSKSRQNPFICFAELDEEKK